ncbi:MAG: hypothetical protein WBH97_01050 [Rectinemataceae bacterium]
MKRIYIALFALLLAGSAFAQTSMDGLLPKSAKNMGMGGAFTTFSTGYDSFFGNPAGFATKNGSLTIADIGLWAYIRPNQTNLDRVNELMAPETDETRMGAIINEMQTENNGLGAGASLGLGWAGKGFGLGLTVVTDETTEALTVKSKNELNAIAGLAFPINLGIFKVNLGADVRAFYRLDSDGAWNIFDIANDSIGTQPVLGGYGFAVDAGTTVEVGPFMLGATVRDFGLGFTMENGVMQDVIDGNLPMGGTSEYILDPKVAAGLGFKFNLGKVLASSIYAEASDVIAVVDSGFGDIWTNLHFGAEVKMFNFLAIRGGLNQGYYSLGAGVDLLFLEVDAAVFTEEAGLYAQDRPRSGVALQVAIRF